MGTLISWDAARPCGPVGEPWLAPPDYFTMQPLHDKAVSGQATKEVILEAGGTWMHFELFRYPEGYEAVRTADAAGNLVDDRITMLSGMPGRLFMGYPPAAPVQLAERRWLQRGSAITISSDSNQLWPQLVVRNSVDPVNRELRVAANGPGATEGVSGSVVIEEKAGLAAAKLVVSRFFLDRHGYPVTHGQIHTTFDEDGRARRLFVYRRGADSESSAVLTPWKSAEVIDPSKRAHLCSTALGAIGVEAGRLNLPATAASLYQSTGWPERLIGDMIILR